MGLMAGTEERIQRSIAQFLSVALAPGAAWWTAVEPVPDKRVSVGARGKAMGKKRGCPDIWVIKPGGGVVGIEVKAPGGSLTKDQRHVREQWRQLGADFRTAGSVEDVAQILREHGVELVVSVRGESTPERARQRGAA